MDDIDRAQQQEEMARAIALKNARQIVERDHQAEICTGCSYVTRTNYGRSCEAWAECLADLQKRERAGR